VGGGGGDVDVGRSATCVDEMKCTQPFGRQLGGMVGKESFSGDSDVLFCVQEAR
jgi:hypothetical protein